MSRKKLIIGLVLIAVGIMMLSATLDMFYFSFRDFFTYALPLALMAIGIWLILRGRGRQAADEQARRHAQAFTKEVKPDWIASGDSDFEPSASASASTGPTSGEKNKPRPSAGPSDRIKYSKFIGDTYVDCQDIDLQNVEISSFIGDVEVKLHGGRLGPGLNRMIISGFIGDVRVLVPQGMAVFAQSSNFIGDIEMMGRRSAGFGNNLDAQTPNYADAESKLYIANNHFIGDVRVYVV